jgi:hypothetical protein
MARSCGFVELEHFTVRLIMGATLACAVKAQQRGFAFRHENHSIQPFGKML